MGADPAFFTRNINDRRPDRADPFTMFASYPTAVVTTHMDLQQSSESTPGVALAFRQLNSVGKAEAILPSPELIKAILACTPKNTWINFDELVRACLGEGEISVARAVVWLSKFGILRCRMRSGK